ncbi:hypothetical protein OsI_15561 [Oryza sativa Indica Group]|uniref:Uncharacterized protein n=1 Tax=Oryza sativa subsp. indica TaxID=39946 RepID=B8ASZ4_ORYSI|nr:hypothetical protein OsI_15561 [Oryza sativa Indica Group]
MASSTQALGISSALMIPPPTPNTLVGVTPTLPTLMSGALSIPNVKMHMSIVLDIKFLNYTKIWAQKDFAVLIALYYSIGCPQRHHGAHDLRPHPRPQLHPRPQPSLHHPGITSASSSRLSHLHKCPLDASSSGNALSHQLFAATSTSQSNSTNKGKNGKGKGKGRSSGGNGNTRNSRDSGSDGRGGDCPRSGSQK